MHWAADTAGLACVSIIPATAESGGDFVDGTIGQWLEDSLAAFDAACQGPQVVIGSSMGGWMALLLARALARRGKVGRATLKGLVLIAPAPDFTEELMWKRLLAGNPRGDRDHRSMAAPSEYGEPLSDHAAVDRGGAQSPAARQHDRCGLPRANSSGPAGPRRALAACFRAWPNGCRARTSVLTMIQDGDHRLSRPQDIARLLSAVAEF